MSTITRTATETVSITAQDVRKVMSKWSRESRKICQAAAHASPDFDADTAEMEVAMLVLQEAICAFSLEFYVEQELVREYVFRICDDGTLTETGPSADNPPTGYIPEKARVRLTVTPNPQVTKEHRDHWFEMLGWADARLLTKPEGLRTQTYGSFASGGFGLQRTLRVNPKFDQPVAPTQLIQKGSRW